MTIQGYQFDKMKVTPEADSGLYNALNLKRNYVVKKYRNQMNVTSSGLNIYIDTGSAIVCGRHIEVTEREALTAMANTEGFVCLTIDLTEVNKATGTPGNPDYEVINNQVRLELVSELNQQDLFNDGQVYTFPLAKYVANGTTVSVTKDIYSYSDVNGGVVVFDGATYFLDTHSYSFDINKMNRGLLLVWSRYTPGTGAMDYGYSPTFIPKEMISMYNGKIYYAAMPDSSKTTNKIFKVFENRVSGDADNMNANYNKNQWALRKVIIL
ncbi:hypothetical protein [Enterococcus dispar]|uniref:hypothetical protein n=1 Tax=Enterococcus dispar TaxID=44009 RepID=UPI00288F01BB|nr:hypothetical protein [Enterococcus dispar]MDT2705770.1 hypothetical protein [Enterococcus dispar]